MPPNHDLDTRNFLQSAWESRHRSASYLRQVADTTSRPPRPSALGRSGRALMKPDIFDRRSRSAMTWSMDTSRCRSGAMVPASSRCRVPAHRNKAPLTIHNSQPQFPANAPRRIATRAARRLAGAVLPSARPPWLDRQGPASPRSNPAYDLATATRPRGWRFQADGAFYRWPAKPPAGLGPGCTCGLHARRWAQVGELCRRFISARDGLSSGRARSARSVSIVRHARPALMRSRRSADSLWLAKMEPRFDDKGAAPPS
jgi:hypothetical protein